MAQRRIRLRGVGPQIEGKYWEAESLLRIGRYEHLEIVLNDASISRRHGELAVTDQGWIVRDLGSTNGTYLNGVKVGRTDRKILAHLPGGDLTLEWKASDNHVYMTGPATEVFAGEWNG